MSTFLFAIYNPRCFVPFERPVFNKIAILDVLYFVECNVSLHPCVSLPPCGIIAVSLVIKASAIQVLNPPRRV